MALNRKIRLGTRGSKLALAQAQAVTAAIQQAEPGLTIDVQIIQTSGDRFRGKKLAEAGGKGLFVKEIETALLENEIDLAVHSLKDLPGDLPEGLDLLFFSKRADPRDCLVSRRYPTWQSLPRGAVIGTGSPRRRAQLLALRSDLKIEPIRGNVDTRLKKLAAGPYDALILAAAGLHRLGIEPAAAEYFDPEFFIPAIGQGLLAIEIRRADAELVERLHAILEQPETRATAQAERAFLQTMGGDCYTPLAAHAWINEGQLKIIGWIGMPDGSRSVRQTRTGPIAKAADLGTELAEAILQQGGQTILDAITAHPSP